MPVVMRNGLVADTFDVQPRSRRAEVVAATLDSRAQPLTPTAATLPRKFRRFVTLLAELDWKPGSSWC